MSSNYNFCTFDVGVLISARILKALLGELIDRSVENKHPKLMLRRTESVVEKLLTNWLSIAMYGYVKVRVIVLTNVVL